MEGWSREQGERIQLHKEHYVAQCPPSIKRSAPVMYELASESRNTTGPVFFFFFSAIKPSGQR